MVYILKNTLNELHNAAVFKRRIRILSRLLSAEIVGGTSVLDLGCGDGSIAKAIMALQPQLEFRGIDLLLRPHTQIPVDVFDGETIPFPNESFDWVTIIDVLHHTDDPKRLIAEAGRVTRYGIVVKDHLREGFGAHSTLCLMDWVGNKGHDVRLPYNYLSKAEWNQLFFETNVAVKTWKEDLGLFRAPFSFLFDRRLHFVATLQ